MKEHKESKESQGGGQTTAGMEHGGKALKSLLKKPGQSKSKGQKNRVVINEKMNEFFAADYIILIKEECCADYEEECDCCCQEHEMIRLGNCKECRAELNLRFEDGGGGGGGGNGGAGNDGSGGVGNSHDDECDEDDEDEDEDDDDLDDEEDDVDECEELEEHHHHHHHPHVPSQQQQQQHHQQQQQQQQQMQMQQECRAMEGPEAKCEEGRRPGPVTAARRHQQRETLSPPEGYKDLCVAAQAQQELEDGEDEVCAECDFYQRQAAAAAAAAEAAGANCGDDSGSRGVDDASKPVHHQDGWRSSQESSDDAGGGSVQQQQQPTIDQAQQTTPDVQQRYLVETITMTTVTERRIVREISEEESRPVLKDEADGLGLTEQKSIEAGSESGSILGKSEDGPEKEKPAELSLAFKLGSMSSSLVSNSLKPNSAVRQLFPDTCYISPPSGPVKSVSADLEDGCLEGAEPEQKFLVTAENLRVFDAAKRSKIAAGSRSNSSESDSSIKRTIERNSLRRSLLPNYTDTLRKKNSLRSKDLTLEERIRQLTCVDEDEDATDNNGAAPENNNFGKIAGLSNHHHHHHHHNNGNANGNPGNNNNNNSLLSVNGLLLGRSLGEGTCGGSSGSEESAGSGAAAGSLAPTQPQLPARLSPSGEERPSKPHHHHHHNSAYRKITDLFGAKKSSSSGGSAELNLPDIGLGGKHSMAVKSSGSKLNSEARKQFLASLAPLSCVASTGVDERDNYYRMPAKPSQAGQGSQAGPERNSYCNNSDSSYSLEDIEDGLQDGIPAPPDVTRGTPTSAGPSLDGFAGGPGDHSDELLAFVEQDKSRTERIKRRYNDVVDELHHQQQHHQRNDSAGAAIEIPKNCIVPAKDADEDDDDELNDYGFNRRPSVRGIKAQFETTNEIVRQLRSRSAAANSLPEACRLASAVGAGQQQPQQPQQQLESEPTPQQQQHHALTASSSSSSSDVYRVTYTNEILTDQNTINRINNMQRQINDIYQTIAESGVSSALIEQHRLPPYLDAASTLPRAMLPQSADQACHRYVEHKNSAGLHAAATLLNPNRMLRIAGGGGGAAADGPAPTPPGVYSTLPKSHRHPQQLSYSAAAGYSCGVVPATAGAPAQPGTAAAAAAAAAAAKCYRQVYFVPYNGVSDPTYQNIQRILPPHSASPNYAEHLERYPYPKNGRLEQQRYYVRPATIPNAQTGSSAAALHLHLHQAEEFQVSATAATSQSTLTRQQSLPLPPPPAHPAAGAPVHPIHAQLQQVHHHHQQQQQQQQVAASSASSSAYNVQLSGVTYSICPPPPPSQATATYTYQMQIQGRLASSDVQTQTSCTPSSVISSGLLSSASLLANSSLPGSLSSGSSSLLSSPTKQPLQPGQTGSLQRNSGCSVAERGVPEGAASAPSHDYQLLTSSGGGGGIPGSTGIQAAASLTTATLTTSQSSGPIESTGPPTGLVDAQNPVYYAMNV